MYREAGSEAAHLVPVNSKYYSIVSSLCWAKNVKEWMKAKHKCVTDAFVLFWRRLNATLVLQQINLADKLWRFIIKQHFIVSRLSVLMVFNTISVWKKRWCWLIFVRNDRCCTYSEISDTSLEYIVFIFVIINLQLLHWACTLILHANKHTFKMGLF